MYIYINLEYLPSTLCNVSEGALWINTKKQLQESYKKLSEPKGPTGISYEKPCSIGRPGAEGLGAFPIDKQRERLFQDFHCSYSTRRSRIQ